MNNDFYDTNLYTSDGALDGYAVIVTRPARLLAILADNTSASIRFLQVFDGSILPSDGSKPTLSLRLPNASQNSLDVTSFHGIKFPNGMTVCSSTTQSTLTLTSTPDIFLTIVWV